MLRSFAFTLLLTFAVAWPGLAAAPATTPPAGEVSALLPAAHVQRGSAPPGDVRLHDSVFWQDWLETEARARARVSLLDGSILNLGSQARVQIVRHDQASEQTELELKFGKVRALVRKIGRPGGHFQVRTDTAVVGVVGTHVYVASTGAVTTTINFDGEVRVASTEAPTAGELVVEPFELAEVERGLPPRKRRATMAELLQALEDTLPGLVTRLQPQQARAGSCLSATSADPLSAAQFPFLELTPRACAGPDLTPLRVCVPESTQPGVYEFVAPVAGGGERWGAFLVEPPAPLQDARLLYSPELPPGATHYARLVGRDNQPLAGVPIRIRQGGREQVELTDETGGFTVQAPETGTVELEVGGQASSVSRGSPGEAPKPLQAVITVVENPNVDAALPEFGQRGSLLTVPEDIRSARLGGQDLPVLRTVTRAGRVLSGIPVPADAPEGPTPLELEQPDGQRRTQPLFLYEVLAARLDQRLLATGGETQGEFLVCVGSSGGKPRKVRARILAVGPVRFRGKGGKGKMFERTLEVEPSGLLRIPFEIQAEKGGQGAGVPFTLTLQLEGG